jgi:glucose/arabinose dehydrogenase
VRPSGRVATALLTAVLLLAGCSDDGGTVTEGTATSRGAPPEATTDLPAGSTGTIEDQPAASEPSTEAGTRAVRLELLAELGSLTAMVAHPETGALYVAERVGRVQRVDPGSGDVEGPIVDIADEVSTDGERGLLGVAISPDGSRLYSSYSDLDGATRVHEWVLDDGGGVESSSRREVFTIDQPYANHNGGDIHFGPDDHLYLGLGDGGLAADPLDTGQDPFELLGTIIRIDPLQGDPYEIPPDNPFVDGAEGAPEVWLFGVRNPWRFSWDRETGDLWIGDVGQNLHEEIDWLPGPDAGRGANLGWSEMEGTSAFEDGTEPADHVPPVFEYGRGEGCSVTGGVVYRGSALPWLRGIYVFGDWCGGELLGLRLEDGEVTERLDLGLNTGDQNLVSFGEDLDGELYVLSLDGELYRLAPG